MGERMIQRGQWHAWGQDPQRPGRTFEDYAAARAWAEVEAPLSCGWGFVENLRTGAIDLFRNETSTWSDADV